MATTNMRIVIRRDTAANWKANDQVVLLQGEQGYEYDTGRLKIGNGNQAYADLPYFMGDVTTEGGDIVNIKAYVDAADSALADRIDTLEGAVAAADSALGIRIDVLETVSAAADSALGIRIDTLEGAVEAADSALGIRVDTLMAYVDSVETALEAADSVLGVRIDTLEGAVEAGDSALAIRIDTLGSYVDSVDTRLGDSISDVDGKLFFLKQQSEAADAQLALDIASIAGVSAAYDTVQDARLDTISAYFDTVDGRLDDLEADTISAGTGVTITNGEIAIGQAVSVSDTVQFSDVTANKLRGDLYNAADEIVVDVNASTYAGRARQVDVIAVASADPADLPTWNSTLHSGAFARLADSVGSLYMGLGGGWQKLNV